jgi:riboflavin transporter FmnP
MSAHPRSLVHASLPIHGESLPHAPYRPFFLTGIIVILTAGAVWGAWLLWQIGRVESFTGVSIHEVNAHGHAQIFGWVGLFIMGFAYQAFPRMWNTTLAFPHLALSAFLLMLIGITLSTLGIWAAEKHALADSAVMIGGIAQIVAVTFFAVQIALTWKRSGDRINPSVAFILGAVVWFVLMTVANLWHTLALMRAESYDALLAQIATYQAALRDMQIHGLALFMILGVSMRFFPGMFGVPKTPAWRGWLGFTLITIAVVAQIGLLINSQFAEQMTAARSLPGAWLLLAVGIGIIVIPWRLWRPLPKIDRSTKFVRAAYLWLGISLAMLLFLPIYMAMQDMAFSHAYYGAVRHAITVGFVSMMIMGVAAKVVPMLNGIDARTLPALWIPFVLHWAIALRSNSHDC